MRGELRRIVWFSGFTYNPGGRSDLPGAAMPPSLWQAPQSGTGGNNHQRDKWMSSKRSPRVTGRVSAVDSLIELARSQLRNGRVADAEPTARRAIALNRKSVEAHLLLAESEQRQGRRNDAVLTLREALEAEPNNALALLRLGIVLQEADRSAEAEFAFKDAIAHANLAEAHLELGNLYVKQQQADAAERCYRDAIAARPAYALAHYNLGNALREARRLDEAAVAYLEAVKLKPDFVDGWYNLGVTRKAQGRVDEAMVAYQEAIALSPTFAEAINNLGTCLRSQSRLEEAEQCFHRALALKQMAMPYYNLALIFIEREKPKDAVESFKTCIAIDPKFLAAQVDLANYHLRRDEHVESEKVFRQLLERHPNNRKAQIWALDGLARLAKDLEKLPAAAELYRRLLAIDPENAEAMAGLCVVKSHMCDWNDRDAEFARLMVITNRQIAADERTALPSFAALARPLTPDRHLAIGRTWANDTKRLMESWRRRFDFRFDRGRRHDRIRIGYVSQDFRNQAMGHLTRTMYGLHDRSAFEIFGYSVRKDDGTTYRRTIESSCEHFTDIHDISAAEGAKRIYADEIDIMVDLMGFTEGNRMAITALRPAPVVVGFLRFPGSSGADFVDYMLTDRIVTTPADQQYYTEQLVYLPNCYQPNDWTQEIDELPMTRAEFGLPDDAFVFSCFNNHYKIEPFIFDLWMRILHQVPKGVLWVMCVNPHMETNLKREAVARGIAADRIIAAGKIAKARHLGRQRLADLFLDTRYYTSHTTGSDALWGGLPVLTCPGETFAARVTASLLTAAGLPEMIVPTFEEYERRAIHLATHPAELKAIRDKWSAQRTTCALFDTKRFVRNLERAYRLIWEDYQAAQPPRPLFVPESEALTAPEAERL
jgi:protein O-GlcNAc transferase